MSIPLHSVTDTKELNAALTLQIKSSNDPALTALLIQLKDLLNQAQAAKGKHVFSTSSNVTENSSGGSIGEQMAKMMGILEELQGFVGKMGQKLDELNVQDGQAMIDQARAALKSTQDEIKKIHDAENSETFWTRLVAWISGIVGVIVGLVTGIAGIATANPALMAMSVMSFVMVGLSASGVIGKAVKGLADLIVHSLQKTFPHLSKKDAAIIADVILIVSTVAGTALLCVAGSAAIEGVAATADVVAEGTDIELTTFASQGGELAEAGDAAAEEATEAGNAAYRSFKRAMLLGVAMGSQTVTNSNFAKDLIALLPLKKLAEKLGEEKDKWELGLAITINLLSMIIGGAAVVGAVSSEGQAVSSFLQKIKSALELENTAELTSGFNKLASVFGFVEAGATLGKANVEYNLGAAQAAMGFDQGESQLFQSLSRMADSNIQANTKHETSTLGTHNEEIQDLAKKLGAEEAAYARVLAS